MGYKESPQLIPEQIQKDKEITFGFNYDARTIKSVFLKNKNNPKIIDIEWIDQTGGAGTIFKVRGDDTLLVKIYCDSYNGYVCNANKLIADKIRFMVDNSDSLPLKDRVCWPIDAVYSDYECKTFLGFLMKKADVGPCENLDYKKFSLFNNLDLMTMEIEEPPNKTQILNCFINLLKIFKELHNSGVVYGDVHPGNFLFDDNGNAFVIDMDSVQIGDFPADYLKEEYLPGPLIREFKNIEKVEKYLESNYRLKEYDEYAIAIMLFDSLVTMSGSDGSQYDCFDNEGEKQKSLVDLTCECAFPYRLEEDKQLSSKVGSRQAMNWSHLPEFVKKAFIRVFKEKDIVTVDEWIKILSKYSELINEGVVSGLLQNNTYESYSKMKIPFENYVSQKGCSIYSAFCLALGEANAKKLVSIDRMTDLFKTAGDICSKLYENMVVKLDGLTVELKRNRGILCEVGLLFN